VMKGGGDLDRAAVDLGGKASRRPGPGLHQLGRPRRSPPPGRAVRPPPACALSAQGCSR
jgi:hypothetical protein